MITTVGVSTRKGVSRRFPAVTCGLVVAVLLAACDVPVEPGPSDMADVDAHLDLTVAYMPTGCAPAGLGGDGRGTIVGAGFECPDGTTLRIQRFDRDVNDDPLPATPAETSAGRVEWRDGSTGDAIRVASDDLDVEVLLRVAESIEVRD